MKFTFFFFIVFDISKLNSWCWRAAHLLSSTTLMSKPGRWSLMLNWWVCVRNEYLKNTFLKHKLGFQLAVKTFW